MEDGCLPSLAVDPDLKLDGLQVQEAQVCSRCKTVLAAYEAAKTYSQPQFSSRSEILYETTELLECTANEGCDLCKLIFDGLYAGDDDRLRQSKYTPDGREGPFIGQYSYYPKEPARDFRMDTLCLKHFKPVDRESIFQDIVEVHLQVISEESEHMVLKLRLS